MHSQSKRTDVTNHNGEEKKPASTTTIFSIVNPNIIAGISANAHNNIPDLDKYESEKKLSLQALQEFCAKADDNAVFAKLMEHVINSQVDHVEIILKYKPELLLQKCEKRLFSPLQYVLAVKDRVMLSLIKTYTDKFSIENKMSAFIQLGELKKENIEHIVMSPIESYDFQKIIDAIDKKKNVDEELEKLRKHCAPQEISGHKQHTNLKLLSSALICYTTNSFKYEHDPKHYSRFWNEVIGNLQIDLPICNIHDYRVGLGIACDPHLKHEWLSRRDKYVKGLSLWNGGSDFRSLKALDKKAEYMLGTHYAIRGDGSAAGDSCETSVGHYRLDSSYRSSADYLHLRKIDSQGNQQVTEFQYSMMSDLKNELHATAMEPPKIKGESTAPAHWPFSLGNRGPNS